MSRSAISWAMSATGRDDLLGQLLDLLAQLVDVACDLVHHLLRHRQRRLGRVLHRLDDSLTQRLEVLQ